MGKKPRKDATEEDPVPAIRIDGEFHKPLRRICKTLNLGITRVVNQAVREFLEREGAWPPKSEEPK